MKFLTIYKPAASTRQRPPNPELFQRMGMLIRELEESGVLLSTGGLDPNKSDGLRLVRSGGTISVHDGPFAEAKEQIGGYAVLQVKSRQEAIEVGRRFLEIAGDGESEYFELAEM